MTAPRANPTTVDPVVSPETRALSASRAILQTLFGPPAARTFTVRYWDGPVEEPAASAVGLGRLALLWFCSERTPPGVVHAPPRCQAVTISATHACAPNSQLAQQMVARM
jgi:hypothetical protein